MASLQFCKIPSEIILAMSENKILFNTGSIENISEEIGRLTNAEESKLKLTPANADSGLAKLVLTLVELIRKLVEKQAMRRVDGGSLSDDEIENLGETLMKLEMKMEELKKHFNLTDRDLNINLGPLGDLM
jgi:Gas vesicle protein K